jgi:hypothetical protein
MRQGLTWAACVAACLAASALFRWDAVAQTSWLPPPAETAAVEQLADRLSTLPAGDGPALTPQDRLQRARTAVGIFRSTFETWGLDGTVSRAPRLDAISLPSSDNRLLDAMGRYQFCNLVLALQVAPAGRATSFNRQFTGVMGLTGITLAVVYLRQPFLAAGGTDEELEAYMTGPAMEAVASRVQDEPALLDRARAGCSPIVVELVTKVIE